MVACKENSIQILGGVDGEQTLFSKQLHKADRSLILKVLLDLSRQEHHNAQSRRTWAHSKSSMVAYEVQCKYHTYYELI